MSELLEQLEQYGADVKGAMGRFLEDHDLYGTCFSMFLKEENLKSWEPHFLKRTIQKHLKLHIP